MSCLMPILFNEDNTGNHAGLICPAGSTVNQLCSSKMFNISSSVTSAKLLC